MSICSCDWVTHELVRDRAEELRWCLGAFVHFERSAACGVSLRGRSCVAVVGRGVERLAESGWMQCVCHQYKFQLIYFTHHAPFAVAAWMDIFLAFERGLRVYERILAVTFSPAGH